MELFATCGCGFVDFLQNIEFPKQKRPFFRKHRLRLFQ